MERDKYSILRELTGLGISPTTNNRVPRNTVNNTPRWQVQDGSGGIPLPQHGFKLSFCAQMEPWQGELASRLSKGQSVYMIAAPGGGKTLPMVCYWAQDILKLNVKNLSNGRLADLEKPIAQLMLAPESLKKILISVPVRSLNKTTQEDFIKHYSQLITQFLEYAMFQSADDRLQNIIFDKLAMYDNKIRSMGHIRDNLYNSYETARQNNDRATMKDIERKYDVLHKELNMRIAKSGRIFIERELIAFSLRGETSHPATFRRAPIHICVYETAPDVFKKYSHMYDLVVCDEAHLVQAEDITDNDAVKYAKAVYTIIDKLDSNTKLLFLSGTVNINAAYDLSKYIKRCFLKTIYIMNEPSAGNKADVGVAAADWINSDKYLLDLMTHPKENGNLILLFSTYRIGQLVKHALKQTGIATTGEVDRGVYDKMSPFSKTAGIGDSLKRTPVTQKLSLSPDLIKRMSTLPGASNITNPVTLQCVLSGFGFIFRDMKDTPGTPFHVATMTDRQRLEDNAIVGNLFAKGKIRTLLATSAVGIGVNISVKKCYIPTLMITQRGGVRKQMRMAQLSQILNRSGRTAFKIANIYTPQQWVQACVQALNMGSGDFEKNATVIAAKGICKSYTWFEKIYKRAMNIPVI